MISKTRTAVTITRETRRQVTPGATTLLTRKGALAPLCRETLTCVYPLRVYDSRYNALNPQGRGGSPRRWLTTALFCNALPPLISTNKIYSESLALALSARAGAEVITSSKFSSTSPGKFSSTLVERATRPFPSSKSIITALIG
jgi:hypothetical protein